MDDAQWRFSHDNKVEAKYCPIEIDGDVKYYICPRNEICCTFGCCISSNLQFYQLWYYWLMVVLMFLLCSGGTWWYRYWLTAPPPPHPLPHPLPTRHRPPPARVTYHAGRNTVVVHQIWKPPRNGPMGYPTPPPSYSVVQSSSQPVASGTSVVGIPTQVTKLKPSPYYQLYGPPPSYDSVVAETQSEPSDRDLRSQHGRSEPPPSEHTENTSEPHCSTSTQTPTTRSERDFDSLTK